MLKALIGLNVLITCLLVFACAYREERTYLDQFLPFLRVFKTITQSAMEKASHTRDARTFMSRNKKIQSVPSDFQFPCRLNNFTRRSSQKPTSVHRLRPSDIDVIGAIGDSLTAGFGVDVDYILGVFLHEGRGSAAPGGGAGTWRTHLTLPNIVKKLNPKLYGYATNSISIDARSRFNVAEMGAISQNMPYMAKVLVNRIRGDKKINWATDWKMISVFIGHNDFCSEVCYLNDINRALVDHKTDMLEVLRTFREHLPRTVVNLLPPLHLKLLFEMRHKSPQCQISHLISCPCLMGLPNAHLRPKMMEFMRKWQELDLEIADYEEFDREDFTVIGHRFMLNFSLPSLADGSFDYGYMAPDCFHASQRAHAKFANDLWNSLLEPYGKKTLTSRREFTRFLCPTANSPFIYTRRNSK